MRDPGAMGKADALALIRDKVNVHSRTQLKQVFDAPRELMTPPDPPTRRFGFLTLKDLGKKASRTRCTGRTLALLWSGLWMLLVRPELVRYAK